MAPQAVMPSRKKDILSFKNEAKVSSTKRKQEAKRQTQRKIQSRETHARLRRVEPHNFKYVNAWGTVCIVTEFRGLKQYWRSPITIGQHIDELPEGLRKHRADLRRRGYHCCNYFTCGVMESPDVMQVEPSPPNPNNDPELEVEPVEDPDTDMEDACEEPSTPQTQSDPEDMGGVESHSTTVLSTPTLYTPPTIPTMTYPVLTPATPFFTPSPPDTDFGDNNNLMADTPSKPPTQPALNTVIMSAPVNRPGTFLRAVLPPIVPMPGGQANVVPTAPVVPQTLSTADTTSRKAQEQTQADAKTATVSTPPSTSLIPQVSAHSAVTLISSKPANVSSSTKKASTYTAPSEERKDASQIFRPPTMLPLPAFVRLTPLQSSSRQEPASTKPRQQATAATAPSAAPKPSSPATSTTGHNMVIAMSPAKKSGSFLGHANGTLSRNTQMEEQATPADIDAAAVLLSLATVSDNSTSSHTSPASKPVVDEVNAGNNADNMQMSDSTPAVVPTSTTTPVVDNAMIVGNDKAPSSAPQKTSSTTSTSIPTTSSGSHTAQEKPQPSPVSYIFTPPAQPSPAKVVAGATTMPLSSAPSVPEELKSADNNGSREAQDQPTAHQQDAVMEGCQVDSSKSQTPATKAPKIVLRVGWQPKSWDRNTDEPSGSATWNKAHKAPVEWSKPGESAEVGEAHESEYLEDLNRAKDLLEDGENPERNTPEVRKIFEEVYELCKSRDKYVDTSDRQLKEVASVDMLCSQGLGSQVSVFNPRKADGVSPKKLDNFEEDLITIQRRDPVLWEHLIGALLQRNCTLEQLLVDVPDEEGGIEKDWDIFQIILDTKASLDWEINWRRIDDVSAKVRYGVSQSTEDFYTATTLKGSSRKDFNIIVDMVTSKGYFSVFADQVKQWAVTRQADFLRIVHRAGFGDPDELDEMANLVKWVKSMCMYEHGFWEETILACIAARYPQWYDRCGDGVEEDDD